MYSISHRDFACLMNMIDCINKIQEYSKKFDNADDFYSDSISFDASMMNFIVIGEMTEKFSEAFINGTSTQIDWLRVKAFRNIIEHNYFGIDAEEVWQIIHSSLPTLKKELEKMIA